MSTESISDFFVAASREAFRFPSVRGQLTIEDLWNLPLTARSSFSLNDVAIAINTELKTLEEESFVESTSDPRRPELKRKLEIVKFIIKTKQAEAAQNKKDKEQKQLRDTFRGIIANKKHQSLVESPVEDLEAQLHALENSGVTT